MTLLLLVRHGETESNRNGLALGRANVALNELGRKQARWIADALAIEPLVAVYASPLLRTLQTAQPIAAAHGLSVIEEPGIIEMNIGELEGLAYGDLRRNYPELLDEWVGPKGHLTVLPGGECLSDVYERATEAVHSIAARHVDGTVCVVTHNFVILSLLAGTLTSGPGSFRRLRHNVGGITTLEMRAGRPPRVLRLNDTCHLRG